VYDLTKDAFFLGLDLFCGLNAESKIADRDIAEEFRYRYAIRAVVLTALVIPSLVQCPDGFEFFECRSAGLAEFECHMAALPHRERCVVFLLFQTRNRLASLHRWVAQGRRFSYVGIAVSFYLVAFEGFSAPTKLAPPRDHLVGIDRDDWTRPLREFSLRAERESALLEIFAATATLNAHRYL
jgi:hypothetical protein